MREAPTQTASINKELKGHEAKHGGNFMSNLILLVVRSVTASMICALALGGVFGAAARAETGGKEITRVDRKATPTEPGKYPNDMVVPGGTAFDGSYASLPEYRSEDRKFTVALWESGPGVLKTNGYP